MTKRKMKGKMQLISLITLGLFLMTGVSTFAKKKPDISGGSSNHGVTYLVNIETPPSDESCYSYVVLLRDENGEQISAALDYHFGINSYIFHEMGPVIGTRTAFLERTYGSTQYVCNELLVAEPDQIMGEFMNGFTYQFTLDLVVMLGND